MCRLSQNEYYVLLKQMRKFRLMILKEPNDSVNTEQVWNVLPEDACGRASCVSFRPL